MGDPQKRWDSPVVGEVNDSQVLIEKVGYYLISFTRVFYPFAWLLGALGTTLFSFPFCVLFMKA